MAPAGALPAPPAAPGPVLLPVPVLLPGAATPDSELEALEPAPAAFEPEPAALEPDPDEPLPDDPEPLPELVLPLPTAAVPAAALAPMVEVPAVAWMVAVSVEVAAVKAAKEAYARMREFVRRILTNALCECQHDVCIE